MSLTATVMVTNMAEIDRENAANRLSGEIHAEIVTAKTEVFQPLQNATVLKQLKTGETSVNQQRNHFSTNNKNLLSRTYSFDRIKQFPTYFCGQNSVELAIWLASSKIRLSSYLTHFSKQFHGLLLAISVYTVVAFLTVQMMAGLITILTITPPPGFFFLCGCILMIAFLASQSMVNNIKTPPMYNTILTSTTLTNQRRSRPRISTFRILSSITDVKKKIQ